MVFRNKGVIYLLSGKQIELFRIYEELENNGISLMEELKNNGALRTRASRCFDSIYGLPKYKSSLFAYGYIDLVDLFGEGYRKDSADISQIRRDLLDWVAEDIISNDFERSFSYYVKNFSGVEPALYEFYSNTLEFYEDYEIPPELIYYNSKSINSSSFLFYLGVKFENLVRKFIFPTEPYQVVYKDCIPDFIIGGNWLDVKLSKSTVFSPNDSTINKYLKHMDKVTILYGIEDDIPTSFYEDLGVIEFVSVTDFYSIIPKSSVIEIEEHLKLVKEFKEATK